MIREFRIGGIAAGLAHCAVHAVDRQECQRVRADDFAHFLEAVGRGQQAAAIGYSQYSGVPFEHGIIRNHYVGRTFIQPTQSVRELGVRMKHSANRAAIEGKRIILIDDSLVRGTTSKKIVRMMRDAGAREVHFRLASPPILYPDYYGIDLPDRDGLLAATHSIEEMREIIGADSLAFLSIDGMYRAMGEPGRDPANPKFSDHCFTGAYPTHLTDQTQVEPQPRQLSLLAEAS